MNPYLILLLFCCILLIQIGGLKLANYRKEMRYRQFWLLPAALLFVSGFLLFNKYILTHLTGFLYEIVPLAEGYTSFAINTFLLGSFLVLKLSGQNIVAFTQYVFRKKKKKSVSRLKIPRVIKRLIILLPEKLRKSLLRKDSTTVAFFYKRKGEQVVLKKEWVFTSILLTYSVAIPVIILFLLAGMSIFFPEYIAPVIPGEYPVLSFILVAEFAWFLGGPLPIRKYGVIQGDDAIVNKSVDYDQLYNEYERLWPERILKKAILEGGAFRESHYYYEKMTTNHEVQMQINALCDRLKRERHIIRESYCRIYRDILEEKDILIEDPHYHDLSPYLFAGLVRLLTCNKKIAVIASSKSHANEMVEWLKSGIVEREEEGAIFTIATFHEVIEQNIHADVLVLTPADLSHASLHHYLSQEKNAIGCVMLPEAERILNSYGLFLQQFIDRLKRISEEQPHIIILSKWQEDLEQTVRNLLGADPRDNEPFLPLSTKIYYMLWRKEGDALFQDSVVSRMVHRRIEADAVLAVPAIKYGVERITYLNQNRNPIEEGLEEIKDNREQLRSYMAEAFTFDTLSNRAIFHRNTLEVSMDDYQFAIVRDVECNVVDTLVQWLPASKKVGFIHVVSPPYLLRDYLTNCIDYFIDNNRKISPLSIKPPVSLWNNAFQLLDRLCTGGIEEEEVRSILTKTTLRFHTVVHGINRLFNEAFHHENDYSRMIEINTVLHFNKDRIEFQEKTYYTMAEGLRHILLPDWLTYYDIKTQSGIVLDQVLKGNVYQNYLEGQLCSFEGKLYSVQCIDHMRGVVELSFEVPFKKERYRNSISFTVTSVGKPLKQLGQKQKERFTVTFNMIESHVKAETNGYFSFEKGVDLECEKTNFIAVNKEETKREYRNSKALEVKIETRDNLLQSSEQLAFTLSFLLNEVFVSLFPYSHQYIAASTVLPEDYFSTEVQFTKNLGLLYPQMTLDGLENTGNVLALYIIEDSPVHLGILESIMHRFDHILEILDDYLHWLLNEDGTDYYIRLGAENYSPLLNLEDTLSLIEQLLPSNTLRENRLKNTSGTSIREVPIIENKGQCDFCGSMLPPSEYDRLEDGRERCHKCAVSAVDVVDDLKRLNIKVRGALKEYLNITVKSEIEVTMVNAKELHTLVGESFIPTPSRDSRLIGLAVKKSADHMYIYIENGAPTINTIGTLVHELTHIWQYENLEISDLSIETMEGHAVWTEIYICEQMGEHHFAETLKENMQMRDDCYGVGYRAMLELLKENNCADPFELLSNKEVIIK